MCYCPGVEKWKEDLWLVLEDSCAYFWSWDIRTGEVYFSSRWAELIGCRPEGIKPHISTWEKLVHPDDLLNVKKALNDCLKGLTPRYEAEYRLLSATGGWRWVLSRGKIVAGDGRGGPLRVAGTSLDITERKQAEEDLRDVDVKHKEMADLLPQIIFETDEKGNVTYGNRCAFELFGYTPADLKKGLNMFQMVIPEDREMTRKNSRRILSGEKSNGNEYTALRKEGGTFPIAVYTAPIIRGNRTAGIRGIIIDLTERKQGEEMFKTLSDCSPIGVYIIQDGKFQFVNPQFLKLTGYSKEELLGKDSIMVIIPEDREAARKNTINLLKGRRSFPHEFRGVTKSGDIRWVLGTYASIQYQGKRAVLGNYIDITRLKQSEENLRAAHRQLLDTIEFFPDATLIIDNNGKVVAWNQAMEEMTGVRKENMIGRGEYAYAVPFYGERKPILIDSVISEDREVEELYSGIKRKGNTLYGEIYTPALYRGRGAYLWGKSSPLFDSEGNITGAIEYIRDITERKQAETQLKYLSLHDPLTGLYNRNYFEEKMRRLESGRNEPAGVIVCDIDGLKLVNDTMGHEKGDLLLVAAARALKESFRDEGVVARIGGDEFAALVTGNNVMAMESMCERIHSVIKNYNKSNPELPLSISVGFSTRNDPAAGVDDVFREADNKMYREKLHRNKSARSAIVQTLMKALEERDFITEGHAERLQNLAVCLAGTIGLSRRSIADLKLLARFHDIGKVGIPDRILFKPGPLTHEEYVEMQRHCEIGCRIAMSAPDLVPIADWILKHHEWWNGKGYPLGIKGKEIPLECRILAIIDAYDAMTSDRPYRKALTAGQALNELARCAGTQFDPQLVEKFISIIKVGLKGQKAPGRRTYSINSLVDGNG